MLLTLQNPLVWIALGVIYLGMAIFFVGCAKHNNNVISGVGALIIIGILIYAGITIVWWVPLVLFVFAFITQMTVPHILGFLYWKIKYNPKFLTLSRFGGLIFEQYQKVKFKPLLTDIFIEKAVDSNLGDKDEIMLYVREILEGHSKYIAEELLGDYKLFSYYINLRKRSDFDDVHTTISRELGIAPFSQWDEEEYLSELSKRLK